MSIPADDAKRKMIRAFQGFIKYFPDAVGAVALLSKVANEQHNPGEPMHWAKEKSTEELDSLMNHLIDVASKGPDSRDADGVLDAVKIAWRAMANLQRLADSGVDVYSVVPPMRDVPEFSFAVRPSYEVRNDALDAFASYLDTQSVPRELRYINDWFKASEVGFEKGVRYRLVDMRDGVEYVGKYDGEDFRLESESLGFYPNGTERRYVWHNELEHFVTTGAVES